ncbi:hypothetical protein KFK09_026268 [Dendrobium nobile]|uniref:Reverse transcriptase domain-containing protein n=1 Tax=Dendrobium nobile TaxID=94219 RepID=A0A8T3A7R2_DENNO|nr:hypothetical protein KFK09_026268 [Dendrobium nobile]
MDALSCLIDDTSQPDCFEGIKYDTFHLSHLFHADDLLVFEKADARNFECLMRILNHFSNLSSLHLNLHKSSLLISPHATNASCISHAFHIQNSSTKFFYLGLPISIRRSKLSDFFPLIEKVTNLLSSWKVKLLSFADRLQFIKYTISNLAAYWLRGSIIPKIILKAISKASSKFLYHVGSQSKHLQLISCKNTTKPYSRGGPWYCLTSCS